MEDDLCTTGTPYRVLVYKEVELEGGFAPWTDVLKWARCSSCGAEWHWEERTLRGTDKQHDEVL